MLSITLHDYILNASQYPIFWVNPDNIDDFITTFESCYEAPKPYKRLGCFRYFFDSIDYYLVFENCFSCVICQNGKTTGKLKYKEYESKYNIPELYEKYHSRSLDTYFYDYLSDLYDSALEFEKGEYLDLYLESIDYYLGE